MFTQAQILWARSHDWCLSASYTMVEVRDSWVRPSTGERGSDVLTFTNAHALRVWAGY